MKGIGKNRTLDERHDVRGDGRIILYKRPGLKNPKWQARMRVPGATEYKIVSTKTSKLSEAESFANNLYDTLYYHVKAGGSVNAKTFCQIFCDWEMSTRLMSSKHRGGSAVGNVARVKTYALRYFGGMKIDEIKSADFQRFWLWRKENYARVRPGNNTLGRERTAILAVFKYAESLGHIAKIPDSTPPRATYERRPTFSKQEWAAITRKMPFWEQEGKEKSTARDRYLAIRYFRLLVSSGIRVGEMRNLRWGDLWTQETVNGKRVVAHVRGKTGARDVVCLKGTGDILNDLMTLHVNDLQTLEPDNENAWKPNRTRLIFCHPNGTAIKTFKRSFHTLLNFAGVPLDRDGRPRTIYSLRHYYATERLYEEVSPFLLSQQMGTSVEMLQKFYGQTMTSLAASQITKTRPVKKDVEDFFQG